MNVAQLPLPRWEADLYGDDRDLKHLTQHFTGDGLRIYEEAVTGQTLMVIEGFPAETNHGEVLAAALEKAKVLSGVLTVARQSQKPLSVGGVMLRQVDGKRYVHTTIHETLRVHAEFHTQVLRRDSNGQWVPVPQPPPLTVTLAALAQTDPVVAKAMRLRVMPDAGTWRGLVPLFELIDHDVMRIGSSVVKKGWASAKQQKRFKHTANSSAAGDASRHGHEDTDPPPNPMTLDEAQSFVQMVMHAWIADRIAQSGTADSNLSNP